MTLQDLPLTKPVLSIFSSYNDGDFKAYRFLILVPEKLCWKG